MNWNNKTLAIIFFALFGIWMLTNVINKPSTRSFRSTLLAVDTSIVDKVILYPEGVDSTFIELRKEENNWKVQMDNQTANADPEKVKGFFSQFALIPTKQLVSQKVENQANYEVDEQSGKILEIYSKGALLEKVIFGRFNFNQATRASTSYARLDGEDEIYSLDGMVALSFAKDYNSFRNNDLCEINPADIKGINFNNQIVTLNDQQQWVYNGNPLDSADMVNYLGGFRNLTSFDFVNNFSGNQTPDKVLRITADNQPAPVEIACYPLGDSFIIKSSENEAYFSSDSTGVYDKIFGQLEEMLVTPTN